MLQWCEAPTGPPRSAQAPDSRDPAQRKCMLRLYQAYAPGRSLTCTWLNKLCMLAQRLADWPLACLSNHSRPKLSSLR